MSSKPSLVALHLPGDCCALSLLYPHTNENRWSLNCVVVLLVSLCCFRGCTIAFAGQAAASLAACFGLCVGLAN